MNDALSVQYRAFSAHRLHFGRLFLQVIAFALLASVVARSRSGASTPRSPE